MAVIHLNAKDENQAQRFAFARCLGFVALRGQMTANALPDVFDGSEPGYRDDSPIEMLTTLYALMLLMPEEALHRELENDDLTNGGKVRREAIERLADLFQTTEIAVFMRARIFLFKSAIDSLHELTIDYCDEPMEIDDYEPRHRPENQTLVRGVPVNPTLRETFDCTPHEQRDLLELEDWWDRPYVVTHEGKGPEFRKHWPEGARYVVR